MRAWFAGDFEHCLQSCAAVRVRDAETRVHVALLQARALLRLSRADDALAVLHLNSGIPSGTDEYLTAQMLTGEAYIRHGEPERGLTVLSAARKASTHAYRTIRSEIALATALGEYQRRDYDAADRELAMVDADADIVYARALECFGWTAIARGNNERAVAMFGKALDTLDRGRHHDRFLEANCIRALAHLSVERMDRETWRIVEARRSRIDWSASGLAVSHFWTAYCAAAYALDVEGQPLAAAREARHAEHIAPSPAYRVQALCKRASIARYAGEPMSQRDHVEAANEIFVDMKSNDFAQDENLVPLILAEELSFLDSVPAARRALSVYYELTRSSRMLATSHFPTTFGYQRLVEGAVSEAAGDEYIATQRYREAFTIYSKVGYARRATMAALRIFRTTGDRKLITYAAEATAHLGHESRMRREVVSATSQNVRLTAVQREVLLLICQGKSNPEIARLRKRSLHTIRNLVARLFEIFDVSSREELAVQSVRRGLYTPG
ncbi:MAG: Bacterial regulatory protein luxR family [Candidatus Eremiobacteraeota bacterium]|nr:Bacterial regulatory protein luxR family [Candidatus Eremiobacteraeota bacterium]